MTTKPIAVTLRQSVELREAVIKHCRLLKTVARKLEKRDLDGATRTLKTAVSRLQEVSLKHAKELGYQDVPRAKKKR